MKCLQLLALAAALALHVQASAASPARKGVANPPPDMSDANPAQGRGNYYAPYVTDAAGNRTPVLQTPGSVVVVPQQVIQDQQDTTLCGALRNVSGVSCR